MAADYAKHLKAGDCFVRYGVGFVYLGDGLAYAETPIPASEVRWNKIAKSFQKLEAYQCDKFSNLCGCWGYEAAADCAELASNTKNWPVGFGTLKDWKEYLTYLSTLFLMVSECYAGDSYFPYYLENYENMIGRRIELSAELYEELKKFGDDLWI